MSSLRGVRNSSGPILAEDPSRFTPFAVQALLPVVGPDSIFVNRGDRHRQQRRWLMPPFHGQRMRLYGETIAEVARHRASTAAGGRTSMLSVAQSISLEVIIRTVFGVGGRDVAEVETAVTELVAATHPLLLFIPALQRTIAGRGPYARLRRAIARTDVLLQRRIEAARRAGDGTDILSLLLSVRDADGAAIPDSELRDHLRTLLFAGHETTAISIAWAVDQLARHPAVRHGLREALDRDEQDPALDATVYEVLRMFPPVSEVVRALRAPLQLADWTLPTGAVVSPSIHLLHRNPDLYDDPGVFRPDRFANGKPSADRFLPFGGGYRRCLGAAFAQYELTAVLRTLVMEFDFEVVNDAPPRVARRNVTLAPSDGVPIELRVRPRRWAKAG